MALKITTEDLSERQKQLTVEVPQDQIEAAMHRAARQMSKRAHIAGFRPGKAPYEVIVKRYGEEAIFDEALDSLGPDIYRQALENSELDPIAPGSFDDVVSREPLVLRYTVPLRPSVDLGKYRDLRLPFPAPEVGEAAVEEVLEGLRQQQALIEPVDRAAQDSDVIVLDVKGELGAPADPAEAQPSAETEVPAASGDRPVLMDEKGLSLLLAEATDFPFPEVAAHLTGMQAGDEKEVEYTFPADYRNESLRGRRASFHFRCQAVKSRVLPEWSDELARTMGEFEDLSDLRMKVRQSLEAQSRRQVEAEFAEQAIEAVVAGATIVYPPVLLRQEVDDTLHDLDHRLKDQRLSLAEYIKIEKKEEPDLRKELEPQARRRLERALVLGEVVEAEGLEVEEVEVDTAIGRILEPLNDAVASARRALESPAGRRRVALDLLTDKAVARLVQIARGEAPPLTPGPDEGTALAAQATPAQGEADS